MNKTSSIAIRKADADDAPTVLRFIRELAVYEKLQHEVVTTEGSLRQTLFGPNAVAEAWIADWQGEPVGFALFFHNFSTFLGRPGIYLEDLYVTESMRGKGIGKALLRRVAEIAVQRNCGRLEWCVLDWNQNAIDLYRSLGAEAMDAWTVFRLNQPALGQLAASSRRAESSS